MKTITKRILTVSAGLMAGGAILGGIGFFMGGRSGVTISGYGIRSSYSKAEEVKLNKTKLESFSEAEFTVTSYSDINIMASEDGNYYMEYRLDKSCGKPEYEVSNGCLTMEQKDSPGGFINLGLSTDSLLSETYINLYVPKDKELDYLKIYNDTGDVSLDHVLFKDADLNVDFGDIAIKGSKFDSMTMTLGTCDLNLADTEIGIFTLDNEFGENTLKNFKCETAKMDLDTCDLYMDASGLKNLDCDIEFGDVTLLLPEKLETYTFDVSTEFGSVRLPNNAPRGYYADRDDEDEYYRTDGNGKNLITIQGDTSDIDIKER